MSTIDQPDLHAAFRPPGLTSLGGIGSRPLGYLLTAAAVAVAYYGAGRLGLLLAMPPGFATTVWPPSGIALVGVLLFGYRVWPGIWLGSFTVNVGIAFDTTSTLSMLFSAGVASSIAAGSTLQALLGAFLIRRWIGSSRVFTRTLHVFQFLGIEALSCLLAATWGVTSLYLAGYMEWTAYANSWRTWWLGDLIGILTVVPMALTWSRGRAVAPWRVGEAMLSIAALVAITLIVFVGPLALGGASYPLSFAVLPCLVWVAFRFGPSGSAVAACVITGIAIGATINGSGPFVRATTNESLWLLQAFLGIATVTGLVLACALSERDRLHAALEDLNVELELRVRERTAELDVANNELHQEVVERRRAEEEVRQLSVTDELTGLHNRRGFFLLVEQQWKIACRAKKLPKVATFTSAPFKDTLTVTLKVSHNLYASTLPCLVAASKGQTTAEAGLREQRKILKELGVDTTAVSFGGGAGGAPADFVSAKATVQLIQGMAKRPEWDAYKAALPVLGVDGTLAEVVKADSPARGKVFAKTGTLIWYDSANERYLLKSKALAGTMTTKGGTVLYLCVMVNNVPLPAGVPASREGKVLGKLCEVLYEHGP